MKRNKIRYKVNIKEEKIIVLTGNVQLMYRDEEAKPLEPGNLQLFPENEALHTTRQGDYDITGFSGYFKIDVWDGRDWFPVILTGFFPHKENHFSKTECPIDTFAVCEELLQAMAGRKLRRTYREHYELKEEEEAVAEEK
ncbi:MAG: hypothetical protein EBR02_10045 [Alphaproteobacteria bacterium]|nr:hypothetical protein [Alphaproteobacteria bacterium]